MKSIFATKYTNGRPDLPPMQGGSLYLNHGEGNGYSVLSEIPNNTCLVQVFSSTAVINAMKADSKYLWVADLED